MEKKKVVASPAGVPLPVVALVGRQNVGKSTLFNRLIGKRLSIVADHPGVTRDRLMAICRRASSPFVLMDLGGWVEKTRDESEMTSSIRSQIQKALDTADFFIFVADSGSGMLPEDRDVAQMLRKTKKPVIVVINKSDSERKMMEAAEFHQMGFDEPIPISAIQKTNFDLLLNRISELLPATEAEEDAGKFRIALIGRPNVGKSSLLNAISGEERAVVSDEPGTTRDAIDTIIQWEGRFATLVDTAGIKKKKKMSDVEYYSSARTKQAIESADVAAILLDARDGLVDGDKKIAQFAIDKGCGLLVVVNKIDLIENPNDNAFLKYLSKTAPFLNFCPVVFISSLTGENVERTISTAFDIGQKKATPISKEILEGVIYEALTIYSIPSKGKKSAKIYSITPEMRKTHEVDFVVNDPDLIPTNYARLLERHIRVAFDLDGVPLRLNFKAKTSGKK